MIGRYRQSDIVVAELKRKLAAAKKLFVLPTSIISIGGHAGKPLRQKENVCISFFEGAVA